MRLALLVLISMSLSWGLLIAAEEYDPLRLPNEREVRALELTVHDAARQRDIPLRVYLPTTNGANGQKAEPVVLFSHGLGGTRQGCAYLGTHWSARGYTVVFLQHAGSDDSADRRREG